MTFMIWGISTVMTVSAAPQDSRTSRSESYG
jgi:hypothetical protein